MAPDLPEIPLCPGTTFASSSCNPLLAPSFTFLSVAISTPRAYFQISDLLSGEPPLTFLSSPILSSVCHFHTQCSSPRPWRPSLQGQLNSSSTTCTYLTLRSYISCTGQIITTDTKTKEEVDMLNSNHKFKTTNRQGNMLFYPLKLCKQFLTRAS